MKKYLFPAIAFLLVSVTSFSQKFSGKEKTEVIILHVNDMHAKIDDLSKLKYLADSLRSTHPHVFLLSAGDNFTGNPVVDMVADKGYPMIDLMNACRFTASCLGNHEFDLGQEMLNRRMEQATFPFLCGNVDAAGAILKQPRPFIVLDAGKDARIAVLGIIQRGENGLPDSHPSKMTGLKFSDGIATAQQYTYLKKQYGILVALTHLGVEDDARLAESMPQIDLIVGGHSHTVIDTGMIVNGVMIVQAGSGLKYVGKTTLHIENGKVTGRHEELIPMLAIPKKDPKAQASIDQYNSNEELNRVVGYAEKPVEGYDQLGSLMTDAITSGLKVDIAFQNRGGIRILSLPQGDITLNDVYKLDPFGNQVVTYRMTLAEIQSLICNAYNREKQIDLEVSGMTYTVFRDVSGLCSDMEMLDKSGAPLDASRTYTVAVNSYIAAGYRFDHADPGTSGMITTEQLLIDYLGKAGKVDYSGVRRAFVK